MTLITGTSAPRPPLLQRITEHQWFVVDAGLTALFFLGGIGNIFWVKHNQYQSQNKVLFVVALCFATLPIVLRRRFPVQVLIVVTTAIAVATIAGQGFDGLPVVALPLYVVATQYERRTSVVALCAVEATLLISLGVEALLRPVGGNVTFSIVVAGAAWFVGDSIRARRAYVAGLTLQAEERQRREVEQAQQSIAEERLQIARELHDIVAHSLSVIAVQSGMGGHVLDLQPEEARKALAAVELTSRSALGELRRVLGVLRRDDSVQPSLGPAPGVHDLDRLFAQFHSAGVEVTFRQKGDVGPLPPSLDLSVYRIVQEALTNVTKHAGTGQAIVELGIEDGVVFVGVMDDGTSYINRSASHPDNETSRAHHGIIGMQERAAIFGGSLTAGPRSGGGFEVRAQLPLEPLTS